MATFWHGKVSYFGLGTSGTPATVVDLSSYINDLKLTRPIDTAETSTFGSTYKSYIQGLADNSLSISGRWDATLDAQLNNLVGFDNSGTGISYTYGPSGSTATRVKYTGFTFLTSYDLSGSISDVVAFSVNLQNIGAPTRGTF